MMYFSAGRIQSTPATSRSHPGWLGFVSSARLPTDPFFYAPVLLQNIIVGSAYWIAQADNLSNVIASGTAAASTVLIEDVPAYSSQMLIVARVRKATGGEKFHPLEAHGYLLKGGVSLWIAQVPDLVLNG